MDCPDVALKIGSEGEGFVARGALFSGIAVNSLNVRVEDVAHVKHFAARLDRTFQLPLYVFGQIMLLQFVSPVESFVAIAALEAGSHRMLQFMLSHSL